MIVRRAPGPGWKLLMRGCLLVLKRFILRELESAKQPSVTDAAHLELDGSKAVGEAGLENDLCSPWAKTPAEDHSEIASEGLKVIGCIHHYQVQRLGVRSALIGKQGQPARISSIACDSWLSKGILFLQLGRGRLASISSV
jgi:hypothetical protein